jgi:transcriptional regulator with XRE-family HTH domain
MPDGCHVPRISGKLDADGALLRLGAAIREQRLARGLSQEALADAASLDRSHMGKIERGERNVTVLNVIRIARALQQEPSDILKRAGL